MGIWNQSHTRKKTKIACVDHDTTASRRQFLIAAGGIAASAFLPTLATANVPVSYDWNSTPRIFCPLFAWRISLSRIRCPVMNRTRFQ